jgi:hypothetical protein
LSPTKKGKCGSSEIDEYNPFIVTRTAVVVDRVETGRTLRLLREFLHLEQRDIATAAGWNRMMPHRLERGTMSTKTTAVLAAVYILAAYRAVNRRAPKDFDLNYTISWRP